jgi:hypothetical protein
MTGRRLGRVGGRSRQTFDEPERSAELNYEMQLQSRIACPASDRLTPHGVPEPDVAVASKRKSGSRSASTGRSQNPSIGNQKGII